MLSGHRSKRLQCASTVDAQRCRKDWGLTLCACACRSFVLLKPLSLPPVFNPKGAAGPKASLLSQ